MSGAPEWITFDCYGTLIQWEAGIRGALAAFVPEERLDAALADYVRLEALVEAGPYRSYRLVLRETLAALATRHGFRVPAASRDALAESLPTWKPYPEVARCLTLLKDRAKLAILSNVDDDLLAETRRSFPVSFDEIVTAEAVRSYKPAPAHFQEALRRTRALPHEVLHVAQSRMHDVEPAQTLGFRTAWVRRKTLLDAGTGMADRVVWDLDELLRWLGW